MKEYKPSPLIGQITMKRQVTDVSGETFNFLIQHVVVHIEGGGKQQLKAEELVGTIYSSIEPIALHLQRI